MRRDEDEFPCLDVGIATILEATYIECKRLLENKDLFPSGRENHFREELGKVIQSMSELMDIQDTYELWKQTQLKEAVQTHKKRHLPSYDEDRTPWQQFLHNKAPGSGRHSDIIPQEGTTYMFPAAPALMLTHAAKDQQNFVQSLETVSVPSTVPIRSQIYFNQYKVY